MILNKEGAVAVNEVSNHVSRFKVFFGIIKYVFTDYSDNKQAENNTWHNLYQTPYQPETPV